MKLKLLSALLLSSLSTVAFADMKPHVYIGAEVGSADPDVDGADAETSMSLIGGYYFTDTFSAELGYIDFGGDADATTFSIRGKGSYYFTEAFSIYGRAGIGFGSVEGLDGSESNTDLTFGFGASVRVAEKANLTAGYDTYSLGDDISVDVNVISIGAIFHF